MVILGGGHNLLNGIHPPTQGKQACYQFLKCLKRFHALELKLWMNTGWPSGLERHFLYLTWSEDRI